MRRKPLTKRKNSFCWCCCRVHRNWKIDSDRKVFIIQDKQHIFPHKSKKRGSSGRASHLLLWRLLVVICWEPSSFLLYNSAASQSLAHSQMVLLVWFLAHGTWLKDTHSLRYQELGNWPYSCVTLDKDCMLSNVKPPKLIQSKLSIFGISTFYPLSFRWSFSCSFLRRLASWLELGSQVATDHSTNCCLSNTPKI